MLPAVGGAPAVVAIHSLDTLQPAWRADVHREFLGVSNPGIGVFCVNVPGRVVVSDAELNAFLLSLPLVMGGFYIRRQENIQALEFSWAGVGSKHLILDGVVSEVANVSLPTDIIAHCVD